MPGRAAQQTGAQRREMRLGELERRARPAQQQQADAGAHELAELAAVGGDGARGDASCEQGTQAAEQAAR